MRERAGEMFGGPLEVQEWEIGVLHRRHEAPDGACTRVTWTRGDPAEMDRVIDTVRMALLPRLDDLDGFCSVSVDGQPGQRHVLPGRDLHEPRRHDADARGRRAMRDEFTQQLGMEVMDIAEFDLTLHHLRVPETV